MHDSRSEFVSIGSQRLHLRHWGRDQAPLLFVLHGWMDCAATFQFMVEALRGDWHIIAPDWRGFGESDWNPGSYYAPDYLADLDALLTRYSPRQPVYLAGHSMGAMVAGLYAGIRPERVRALALIEGFGLPDSRAQEAPGRYARWLKERRDAPRFSPLPSLESVTRKLQDRNPRLSAARALWLAEQLTHTGPDSAELCYRADPRHKMVNPVLYRLAEAQACWRQIRCPVLWVIGGDMWDHPMAKGVFDTLESRRACFAQLREVTVADSGHMVQWEQPEQLATVLEDFFSAISRE